MRTSPERRMSGVGGSWRDEEPRRKMAAWPRLALSARRLIRGQGMGKRTRWRRAVGRGPALFCPTVSADDDVRYSSLGSVDVAHEGIVQLVEIDDAGIWPLGTRTSARGLLSPSNDTRTIVVPPAAPVPSHAKHLIPSHSPDDPLAHFRQIRRKRGRPLPREIVRLCRPLPPISRLFPYRRKEEE